MADQERQRPRTRAARWLPRVIRARGFLIAAAIVIVLVAANGTIAVAIAASSHPRATNWPSSSFHFWPERDWREVESAIGALPATPRLRTAVLGTVSYRGSSYPLHLLSFASRRQPARGKVLLVGCMHGTEPAGGAALLALAASLAGNPSQLADLSVDIVPIANPWGWVYGYRYTGNGEDINRDLASNRTEEARLLRELFRSRGPYDLVVDLHESKKTGCFLYEYLPVAEGFGDDFSGIVTSMGLPLEDGYHELLWRAEDGVLRIPTAALLWVDLARQLSLDHYARLHGTRQAYTIETPLEERLERRVAVDIAAVRGLARRIGQAGR